MERTKLKAARLALGKSQAEVAAEIGCSKETVGLWELGKSHPQDYWIVELCTFYGKNPVELDLASELTESELAMLQEILKNKKVDRRQALAIVTLPAFAGVDLSTLSKPAGSPEAFLSQCEAVIDACWELFRHGNSNRVEALLNTHVLRLTELANTPTPHQSNAAGLAVQAKIMQNQLATRKLDYVTRKLYCEEAVRFGELSEDPTLHAAALYWQGDTYVYCYRQPQTAIPIFNDALSSLSDDTLLIRSAIYSDLSIAYAQDKNKERAKQNEKMVRYYAELARTAMPKYSELDPLRQYLGMGSSELDQFEGKAYLYLAERFPNSSYAQMAYEAFNLSLGKQSLSEGYRRQALIRKADAARALNEMNHFIDLLREVMIVIRTKKRFSEVYDVMGRIPPEWQKETAIQKLQEDLSEVSIV